MTKRRPIFTVLSLLAAVMFTIGSRPILVHSINQQLAHGSADSADAFEDSGRMSGFALIIGQVACGGMGAVIGTILAGIGFIRREKWRPARWCSLLLNLVAAVFVGFELFPLWRSQHAQGSTGAYPDEYGQMLILHRSCERCLPLTVA